MQNFESILDIIQLGDVVRMSRFGREVAGKAVLRAPAGWVVYLGGPNKDISVATTANVISVGQALEQRIS